MWFNPFSFKGRIGRAQFWLTQSMLGLLDLISLFPVQVHKFSRHVLGGETAVWYFTPVEPVTALSWVYWSLCVAWALFVVFVFLVAVVQRLNDLGISWKWVAVCFPGFVVLTVVTTLFGGPGETVSTVDIVCFILLLPIVGVFVLGMFMMMFLPGHISRHDSMPDNDMRKPIM